MAKDFDTLKIAPGLIGGATPSERPGGWYDANFVRWNEGIIRPIPGWEKLAYSGLSAVASPIRATHTWTDNGGIIRTGILCESNAYVLEGNQLINITPIGGMVGPAADLLAGGYGEGTYGTGTYGTPRPDSVHVAVAPPWWSIDNWGENLVFMSSYDGRLFQWIPNVPGGSVAAVVSGAPTNNRGFVVVPPRYLMMFGLGGNIRRFGWCNQGDISNWAFSDITTTAGFFDIEPSSYIIAAKTTKFGVLIHTNVDVYLSRYIGIPFVFDYDSLESSSVAVNSQSIIDYSGKAAWFTGDSFWRFDGSTVLPLFCPILDGIKGAINKSYMHYRLSGVNIGAVPEVWWFYPDGINTENTQIVIWNFKENWWSKGSLARTCASSYSYTGYPIMSDGVSLFLHEKGFFYPGSDLPWIQSSDLNPSSRTKVMGPMRADNASNDCTYEWITREHRTGNLFEKTTGPLTVNSNGLVDFNQTGLAHFLKVATAAGGLGNWSLGMPQILQHDRGR